MNRHTSKSRTSWAWRGSGKPSARRRRGRSRLPTTGRCRSRRGLCRTFRPPAGCRSVALQPDGRRRRRFPGGGRSGLPDHSRTCRGRRSPRVPRPAARPGSGLRQSRAARQASGRQAFRRPGGRLARRRSPPPQSGRLPLCARPALLTPSWARAGMAWQPLSRFQGAALQVRFCRPGAPWSFGSRRPRPPPRPTFRKPGTGRSGQVGSRPRPFRQPPASHFNRKWR